MNKFKGQQLALFVFESFMAVFYVAIGLTLLVGWLTLPIRQIITTIIGALFLLYGLFRIYRAVKKLFD
jgi:hypothetical protein